MSRIMCIAGPTASGKSRAIALLASGWNIEVINVDSATIYQGMDIGTAKPSILEQQEIKHHLLDIVSPTQSYSVAQFCVDTLNCIKEIENRGAYPVLVGGTMMYYNALIKGLHNLPETDAQVRHEVGVWIQNEGLEAVYRYLQEVDPETAFRLSSNDTQRISRAVEVYKMTQKPLSYWLKQEKESVHSHQFHLVSLEPSERSGLHEKIKARFLQMMKEGFLDEVISLRKNSDLSLDYPSMRCVGYRQLWQYLEGQVSLDEAMELGIIATRQLAKRQMTWLRSYPERVVIDCLSDTVVDELNQYFIHFLGK